MYGPTCKSSQNSGIVLLLLSRHQNLELIAPKLVSIIEIEEVEFFKALSYLTA